MPNVKSLTVAKHIVKELPYDRLYFYGTDRPIHVSYGPSKNRKLLTCISAMFTKDIFRQIGRLQLFLEAMNKETFNQVVNGLAIGKKLPTAIYLHESLLTSLPETLSKFVVKVSEALQLNGQWNLVKLHKMSLKSRICIIQASKIKLIQLSLIFDRKSRVKAIREKIIRCRSQQTYPS